MSSQSASPTNSAGDDNLPPVEPAVAQQRSTTAFFVSDLVAGGLSGIVAKTIGAPVDRVKLLLQTQNINAGLKDRYKGPVDCIVRVYREQGLMSFWRGNLANVYRYFPNQAMNFAFKDRYRNFFRRHLQYGVEDDRSDSAKHYRMLAGNLLSGGAAGATALLVSYPFDVARTKLATDVGRDKESRKFKGTMDCLKQAYRADGFKGLYAGFGISLTGVVLFKALYMGGYDSAKDFFDLEHSSVFVRLVVAQTVTTLVGTIMYPIDTIKRRMMTQSSVSQSPNKERLYRNSLDCLQKILRNEGVSRGLYAGLSVNLVRGFSGSFLLVGYDELKKIFQDI